MAFVTLEMAKLLLLMSVNKLEERILQYKSARPLPSCQACLRETGIKSPPILCSCIPLLPPPENEGCSVKLEIFTIHVTSRAWSLKNEGYSYMPGKSRAGSSKNEGYS